MTPEQQIEEMLKYAQRRWRRFAADGATDTLAYWEGQCDALAEALEVIRNANR